MRFAILIISVGLICTSSGCETKTLGFPHPSNAAPSPESTVVADPIVSPLPDDFDVSIESSGADDGECSRWIYRVDGRRICIDVLLAALSETQKKDNDNDGIPNINDDDIDGDGIPNGYDLDVDGDGIPNSYDDDIDDDGILNENDVDIDGDFIRNRWDLDIDGDLIFNPLDRDADGDGKLKFPAPPEDAEPACGTADIFRDPDECDLDDDDESEGKEKSSDDKGTTSGSGSENGQNKIVEEMEIAPDLVSEVPLEKEIEKLLAELDELYSSSGAVDELREVDPDASDAELLDTAIELAEAGMEEDEPDVSNSLVEIMGEEARASFESRKRSITIVAIAGELSLSDARMVTRITSSAERQLGATLDELTDTIVEVDENLPGLEILEAGALAALFHEIGDEANLPPRDVVESSGPLASAISILEEEDDAEAVIRSVVDRTVEHTDASGGMLFDLPTVALTAKSIVLNLDDPTVETLDESLDNVLDATQQFDLSSPLEVFEAIVDLAESDPTISLSDGISITEADRGAMEIIN